MREHLQSGALKDHMKNIHRNIIILMICYKSAFLENEIGYKLRQILRKKLKLNIYSTNTFSPVS